MSGILIVLRPSQAQQVYFFTYIEMDMNTYCVRNENISDKCLQKYGVVLFESEICAIKIKSRNK